jgi:plasmid stabilization system protein ParE
MRIRHTGRALIEIDEIYLYIARDNETAAARVISQIEHTIAPVPKNLAA